MSRELTKGTKLNNRYCIEKLLGKGGFGITYKAIDIRLDVPVAIKQYERSSPKDQETAKREVKMSARFYDLEGIASARDFFVEDDISYIVMEYVEGISIKKYVYEHGRMDGALMLERINPVLRSLCIMHKEGVIHRDISPDNLMITKRGTFCLIDFGETRQVIEQEKRPLTLVYKRGFAPIEQCRQQGEQSSYTDVYSMCATLYFIATGIVPDDAVERLISDRLKPLSQIHGTGLTKAQEDAIMGGLEVLPENRISTMEELCKCLYQDTEEPEIHSDWTIKPNAVTHHKRFHTAHMLDEIEDFFDKKENEKEKKGKMALILFFSVLFAGVAIVIIIWRGDRFETASAVPSATVSGDTYSPAVTQEATGIPVTALPSSRPSPAPVYKIGNYVGMQKEKAAKRLRSHVKHGLRIRYREKYSDSKIGQVIAQSIKAGKTYKSLSGVTLVLTVSKGEKVIPTKAPAHTPTPKPQPQPEEKVHFDGDLNNI